MDIECYYKSRQKMLSLTANSDTVDAFIYKNRVVLSVKKKKLLSTGAQCLLKVPYKIFLNIYSII